VKTIPIHDHNLVGMLRSFSKDEQKKFSKFLESPYFTFRKSLKRLYSELVRFHPLYTHITLSKEYLYNKIYPGKTYRDSSIRDLLSDLLTSAKQFLVYESLKLNKNFPIYLLQELRKKNLVQQLAKQIGFTYEEIENIDTIDSEFFLLKYRLEAEQHNFSQMNNKLTSQKNAVKFVEEIKTSNIYLMFFFILEIVSNYTNLIINTERFGAAFIDDNIQSIIKQFSIDKLYEQFKGKNKYDFVIEIYKQLLGAYAKLGNWKTYNNYKKVVKKYSHRLSHDEASFHYSRLISCAVLGAKYGRLKNNFDLELLQLYGEFLERDLYKDEKTNYVPASLYRLIIFHAVKVNRVDWLYNIISEAGPKLHPNYRENLQNYALANYYSAAGNYNTAFEYINKLEIDYFMFKYDLYYLKLKAYYDTGELDPALELLHTFRQFIRNDTIITPSRKVFHNNFASFYEKLIKITLKTSRYDIDRVFLKLEKTNNIFHKHWLQEKLSYLAKPAAGYLKSS
jgi:hypothetical protein